MSDSSVPLPAWAAVEASPGGPRITVITPTLNSAAHLEQAIRSVLEQGYPHLEYFIVDGGSTDGTLDIIRRYETQLAGWTSEPDRGISDAFNKGIARATGDLIGIINSDDYYEPGALAAVAKAYRASPVPAIFHGDLMWETAGGAVRVRPRRWRGAIYLDMPVLHPTCFVAAEVYRRVGLYDLSCRLAMDYDLVLRAHRQGVPLVYLPRVIAHFRAGGRSTRQARQCHREVFRSQRRHGVNVVLAGATLLAKMSINVVKSVFRGATGQAT